MGIRVVWDLDRHLATQGVHYDVAVISRPHNARWFVDVVGRFLPDAPIIFDAEALYSRRLSSQANLATTQTERERLLAECRSMRDVETAVLRRVDHVVCISEDEASVARGLTDVPVSVVSPLLRDASPTSASFAARAHVGFVAGWLAGPCGPNSDALLWYAKEVMPRVTARLPWCRLLVTGASPPDDVRWLNGTSVSFVGEVRDLAEFYDSVRVIISPTRFGAGVKLKTVEAIQHGVPVVATSEGAAGLDGKLRDSIAVHDDAAAFADAVISLVTDRVAWERARHDLLEAGSSPDGSAPGVGTWPDLVRSTVRTSVR
jgi:glycosyltransferase involved in cell wall biosynthesis